MQHLEFDLGARLISRTTRRLSLTEAGKRYYAFYIRILKEVHDEESAIKQLHHEPVGHLKVLATMSFGIMEMGKAVTNFMLKYPKIQITLIIGDVGHRCLDPDEYGADLAIGFSQPKDLSVHLRKIGKMAWTLCASPSYLRKAGTPKTPIELTRHSCLVAARPFTDGVWAFNGPSGIKKIKVSGVVSPSSDHHALYGA